MNIKVVLKPDLTKYSLLCEFLNQPTVKSVLLLGILVESLFSVKQLIWCLNLRTHLNPIAFNC